MKFLRIIFFSLFIVSAQSSFSSSEPSGDNKTSLKETSIQDTSCGIPFSKPVIATGWSEWEPYEYMEMNMFGARLSGFDIDVVNAIGEEIGSDIRFSKDEWPQLLAAIESGGKDILPGATYSKERSSFTYFSEAYRSEIDTLYVSKELSKSFNFTNIDEFLAQIRSLNYKIGILTGALYSDDKLNNFIKDPQNSDIFVNYIDDLGGFRGLINKEIQGFIDDKMVGATIVVKNNMGEKIEEVPLNIEAPISLMLSKKTISPELRDKINAAIVKLKNQGVLEDIQRKYLYPVFVLCTANSDWFNYVTMLGVLAFALSGVALSAKDNMTIFGTFFLALLPSVFGLILKELYGSSENDFHNFSLYFGAILAVVLVGFSFVRILEVFNKDAKKDKLMEDFWQNSFVLTDALGQACFIVIGVTVVIVTKLSPIEIWGPVFAFLSANAGGMLRDLFTRDKQISALNGDINAEVTIIWGIIYSLFLKYISDAPSMEIIALGAFGIVLGAFVTRVAMIYLKISNIRFR